MEIKNGWLHAAIQFYRESFSCGKYRRCCRSKARVTLASVGLLLCLYFLLGTSSWTLLSFDHQADVSFQQVRKWKYGSYDTSSSVSQFWDYSDPVLLDAPRDIFKTTVEPHGHGDSITEPHDLSYGIVIDCGSSGSRAFVYTWPKHSGRDAELLNIKQLVHGGQPVVWKIYPGVATFINQPTRIRQYFRPLFNHCSQHIPYEKHRETPVYVLCTAGMRMLTKRQQSSILEQIRHTVRSDTNFQFFSYHAEVISGVTEGLYLWMGLNYALGNLNLSNHKGQYSAPSESAIGGNAIYQPHTIGVIDMGGGSLQIAFEVDEDKKYKFRKHVVDVDLASVEHSPDHKYNVFVDTFLHKGGNAIRRSYERDLYLNLTAHSHIPYSHVINDSCLPLGFNQEVQQKHPDTGVEITLTLNGTGDFQACRKRLVSYLDKYECPLNSTTCILNGHEMPELNYEGRYFSGSSEFFYCMNDILGIGGLYDKQIYDAKAQEYCATPWNITWQRYNNGYYKDADAHRVKFQCFKSAWVSVVIHEGFNLPTTYKNLKTTKLIEGTEIQWTLGAILYKTRYLPLHEIQMHSQAKSEKRSGSLEYLFYPFILLAHSGIFLFACILITLLYLVVLLVRFFIHSDKQVVARLRRVRSSMIYLVNEEV